MKWSKSHVDVFQSHITFFLKGLKQKKWFEVI